MTAPVPALPDGIATVREARSEIDGVPWYPVPGWDRFPWAAHGTTGAGPDADFGLFGAGPAGPVLERWRRLQAALGADRAVHSHQVHGAAVMRHGDGAPGLLVARGYDGHVTGTAGTLLTVSVADCVPLYLLAPARRRLALLHGGWRGTAAGIVEAGLGALECDPGDVVAHLGPAICGRCYEVGPEVHEALGLPVPPAPLPVDLRAAQAGRLRAAGVPAGQVTVSAHCTRCGEGFFSHRAGDRERQLGVLAVR